MARHRAGPSWYSGPGDWQLLIPLRPGCPAGRSAPASDPDPVAADPGCPAPADPSGPASSASSADPADSGCPCQFSIDSIGIDADDEAIGAWVMRPLKPIQVLERNRHVVKQFICSAVRPRE